MKNREQTIYPFERITVSVCFAFHSHKFLSKYVYLNIHCILIKTISWYLADSWREPKIQYHFYKFLGYKQNTLPKLIHLKNIKPGFLGSKRVLPF